MSVNVKLDLPTSRPRTHHHLRRNRKLTTLSGSNTLVESELICASAVSVSAKVTSRFLHKWDKVATDRSSSLRRKIPRRCAH